MYTKPVSKATFIVNADLFSKKMKATNYIDGMSHKNLEKTM